MVPPLNRISSLADLDVCRKLGVQNGLKRYGTGPVPLRAPHMIEGHDELGVSKLCNIWFTRELQKRLDTTGITCIAVHTEEFPLVRPPALITTIIWIHGSERGCSRSPYVRYPDSKDSKGYGRGNSRHHTRRRRLGLWGSCPPRI